MVLVLGILAMTVPALKSAERKATAQTSVLQLLKQPLLLLSSLFPASSAVQISAKRPAGSIIPVGRVKTTGDSPIYRPGTGD